MARPLEVRELIPELQFWIKSPTDPSLRKLLRKTIQTLQAFQDLVGDPIIEDNPKVVVRYLEPSTALPSQAERVQNDS